MTSFRPHRPPNCKQRAPISKTGRRKSLMCCGLNAFKKKKKSFNLHFHGLLGLLWCKHFFFYSIEYKTGSIELMQLREVEKEFESVEVMGIKMLVDKVARHMTNLPAKGCWESASRVNGFSLTTFRTNYFTKVLTSWFYIFRKTI